MWNEFFARLPCSVGLVRWATGRFTIVVKVTLRAPSSGLAPASSPGPTGPALSPGSMGPGGSAPLAWSDAPDPVSLDVVDGAGALVYPSDFAPYKSACDVLVAGAEIGARAADGLIAIDRAEKRVAAKASLGARETFCPSGDPTAPAAMRVWSQPNADFSRFQAAPPDQRIAHPRAPFAVQYRRGDVAIDARFEGGEPTVRLLDRNTQSSVAAIAMALDTILVAPREERVTLVWRGVGVTPSAFGPSGWGPQGAPVLAVDFDGPGVPPTYAFAGVVVEPQMLRAQQASSIAPRAMSQPPQSSSSGPAGPEQTRSDDTRLVDPAARSAGLPFSSPPSRPSPGPDGTRMMVSLPELVASAPVAGAANVAFTQIAPALPSAEDRSPTPSAASSRPASSPRDTAPEATRSPARTQLAPALDTDQTVPAQARVKALTLPFRRVGSGPPSEPREALDARAFAELRGGPAVAPAWDAPQGTSLAARPPMTQALNALPLETTAPADVLPPPLARAPGLPQAPSAGFPAGPADPVPPLPGSYPQIAAYMQQPSYAPPAPSQPIATPSYAPPPLSYAPSPSGLPPIVPRSVAPTDGGPPSGAPRPSSAPPRPSAAPSAPGLPTEEMMKAIQREVWKGERPLAEILKEHGVTESGWREAKRARAKP